MAQLATSPHKPPPTLMDNALEPASRCTHLRFDSRSPWGHLPLSPNLGSAPPPNGAGGAMIAFPERDRPDGPGPTIPMPHGCSRPPPTRRNV